jgi:hypothetical protein
VSVKLVATMDSMHQLLKFACLAIQHVLSVSTSTAITALHAILDTIYLGLALLVEPVANRGLMLTLSPISV